MADLIEDCFLKKQILENVASCIRWNHSVVNSPKIEAMEREERGWVGPVPLMTGRYYHRGCGFSSAFVLNTLKQQQVFARSFCDDLMSKEEEWQVDSLQEFERNEI